MGKRAGRHVRICLHRYAGHCTTPHGTGKVQTRRIGRSREIRTPDPLVPNQMRYQTALCSEAVHCNRLRQCRRVEEECIQGYGCIRRQ